jgi:hypothetical protein
LTCSSFRRSHFGCCGRFGLLAYGHSGGFLPRFNRNLRRALLCLGFGRQQLGYWLTLAEYLLGQIDNFFVVFHHAKSPRSQSKIVSR